MKQAEECEALVIRLYEMEGRPTTARVKLDPALAPPNAPVAQTDILEQPLAENTASMADGVLSVEMPAFGMVTVKIGEGS